MIIFMLIYVCIMVVTYEFADYALFRIKLYEGDRFESSENECKAAAITAGILWPVTLWKIAQLNREIDEIEKWR